MLWLLIVTLITSYNPSETRLLQNDFEYWGIALIDSFPSANCNGIGEPGETLAMVITVRNISSDPSFGCGSNLFTSNPYILLFDPPLHGDSIILVNRTGRFTYKLHIHSSAPWGTSAEFLFTVWDTVGHNTPLTFCFQFSRPNQLIGEHNLGSLAFTIYPYGSFYDFRLPRDSLGVLPKGSLWIGNSESFVLDRDYGPNDDWQIDTLNEGYLALGGTQTSDEDAQAVFNDSGHPSPKGIDVVQQSHNWIDPPYDKFVIVRYLVTNTNSAPIDSLYVGQFMNYDIVDSIANLGGVDSLRRLVYMWNDTDSFYYGVKLLDPQFISNLSLIDNSQYLAPDSFIPDSIKFKFLNGALILSNTPNPEDYSAFVSTGPSAINPGDTQLVAFAILGGDGLQELYLVADNAQRLYDSLFVEIEENKDAASPPVDIFTIKPNPARNRFNIEYTLTEKAEVNLLIFDVTGSLVKKVTSGNQMSGTHNKSFNITKLPQGVYFIKLDTGDDFIIKKAIFLK